MKTNPSLPAAPCTTQKPSFFRRWKLKALAGFFILSVASAAQAAVISVDTLCQCGFKDDGAGNCDTVSVSGIPVHCFGLGAAGDGDGFCSFGEAIVAAGENFDVDGCKGGNVVGPYDPLGDTIVLPSGQTLIFTAPDNFDPDIGPNALPVVEQLLLVEGSGSRLFRDPGSDPDRPAFMRFIQDDGLLSVNKLTFEFGNPGCASRYCGDAETQPTFGENCDVRVCSNSSTTVCATDADCDGGVCVSGNVDDGVGCDSQCRFESCGNGVLDPGEQCDGTSTCSLTGADCTATGTCPGGDQCILGDGTLTGDPCTPGPDGDGTCQSKYGDVDAFCGFGGETCVPNAGVCSNCEFLVNGSLCGNGITDSGEFCDNGAHCVNSDGTDSGVECGNNPLACGRLFPICAPVAGDGCDEFCQLEKCGNGVVDDGEECDPGSVCANSDGFPYEPEIPCATDAQCQTIGVPADQCLPRPSNFCNGCQIGAYGQCYDAGAILVGRLDLDSGGSGATTYHCSLTGKACDPVGNRVPCLPVDSQEPNLCVADQDTGGGNETQPAYLEVSNSTFVKNATTTPDASLTDPPTPAGLSSGVGGAILGGVFTRDHVTDTTFSKNASIVGGAILGLANQEITIGRSTFNDNLVVHDNPSEDSDGPGLVSTGVGGALAAALSNVTVTDSALYNNAASQESDFPGQFGGGIASICSDFALSNSSVFGNEAQLGGGVFASYGFINCSLFLGGLELPEETDPFSELLVSRFLDSDMEVGNSTITENFASEEGGGLHVILDTSDRVRLQETILGGNGLFDVSGTSGPNCEGAFTSEDYNLIGADLTGCSFAAQSHDQVGDPDVACDDTGTVPGSQSCPPNPASLANDRGGPACTSFDQVGTDRYGNDGACDVGAIEANNQTCGNGLTETPLESCDDGSQCDNGADCTFDASVCATIGSGTCAPRNGDGCDSTCILESCGNSVVDAGEQCDDGNLDNFDACNNACLNTFCGDAITNDGADLAGAEACDDGNADDLDFCRNDCTVPVCGDTTVSIHAGEECEDGVTVLPAGAACVNCVIVPDGGGSGSGFCGDGVIQGGEECDNGASNSDTVADACRTNCQLAHCGDDVVDAGEDCDDGGLYPFDGCTQYCKNNLCGDGIRNIDGPGFEECDDANMNDNDFCYVCFDARCGDGQVQAVIGEECDNGGLCVGGGNDGLACEEDFQCPGGVCTPQDSATCTATCDLKTCGDGVLDPGEACDDGNTNALDGCNGLCEAEDCGDGVVQAALSEQCDDGGTTAGDGCGATCQLESCGDGTLQSPAEQCDDGNTNALDGCNGLCQTEICGDGVVQVALSEQCDDGGTAPGDGCSETCQNEVAPACGDGILQGSEACDDDNLVPGDGCSPTCAIETCGDGIVTAAFGEECDDGGTTSGDGCSATCKKEIPPDCGDGNPDPGEACDDHNNITGDGCTSTCEIETCGDGIVSVLISEECDDGGTADGDGCSANCQNEVAPRCGDGILQGGEDCDDGNTNALDGCNGLCQDESCGDGIVQASLTEDCEPPSTDDCDSACHDIPEAAPFCGNGVTDPGEECDDNNTNTNDDCVYCRLAQCGDDFIHTSDSGLTGDDALETCDDGAQSDGDGCSADCELEVPPLCGNGAVDSGEDCDDGNDSNSDNCKNNCTANVCGDGFIELGVEQCDDGGTTANDGCGATCLLESCGDGVQQSGETCDDHNNTTGDGCSSTCQDEVCGDGIISFLTGEQCEPPNSASCDAFCHSIPDPFCGDGVIQTGEQCDDGNTNPHDFCKNDCSDNICGDGVVHFPPDDCSECFFEECDDGNGVDNDSCSDDCLQAECGDGDVQIAAGEECDPEDGVDYEGLYGLLCVNCELEPGGGQPQPFCGDGAVDSTEECDDGNSVNTDACTNNCRNAVCGDGIVESGVEECDGTFGCLAGCVQNVCGDGVVLTGVEQCDDDNTTNGDGCDSNCLNEEPTTPEGGSCGDGTVNAGEECDEGEAHNSDTIPDACRTDCKAARCGDDVIDSDEECDGNRADCDPDNCKIDACAAIAADARSVVTKEDFADFLKKYDIGLDGHSNVAGFEECVIVFSAGGQVDVNDIKTRATNSSGCSLAKSPSPVNASTLPWLALFLAPAGLMGLKRLRGKRVYVRSRRR